MAFQDSRHWSTDTQSREHSQPKCDDGEKETGCCPEVDAQCIQVFANCKRLKLPLAGSIDLQGAGTVAQQS